MQHLLSPSLPGCFSSLEGDGVSPNDQWGSVSITTALAAQGTVHSTEHSTQHRTQHRIQLRAKHRTQHTTQRTTQHRAQLCFAVKLLSRVLHISGTWWKIYVQFLCLQMEQKYHSVREVGFDRAEWLKEWFLSRLIIFPGDNAVDYTAIGC